MSEPDHVQHSPPPTGSFWRSRAGIVLIVFTVIAGLLLAYEHRAHLLIGNGLLLVLLAFCVGIHFFMHGGHGGRGGGDQGPDDGDRP
ncbi:DUF2933 domain-containing protein [Sedimenticola selenatireducens]|uniref:DUF2933 domain-containing protein n=1 Tax=Sedimenticola selenatireducens TaxID=191960 RepID=UPI00048CB9ED|nr:DUF2933 domain-containing protein [Sedimenticola selenatireducens]